MRYDEEQSVALGRRMYHAAMDYERSARHLSQEIDPSHGRASTLLGILALEIIMKCAALLETGHLIGNHEYRTIWEALPSAARDEVLSAASERFAGHVDFTQLEDILKRWREAFVRGRYDYEASGGRSDEEEHLRGKIWEKAGAKMDEADFAYYPMERDALYFGFRRFVEHRLSVSDPLPI